jgi:hypothetical protein
MGHRRIETFALVAFAAAFVAVTLHFGVLGDEAAYVLQWRAVLDGQDPWQAKPPINAYGPLFNALAPLLLVGRIAGKLVFAGAYILFVAWLARRRTLPWPILFGLLILNPFPWQQLAYGGYFDILLAIACVAAVDAVERRRDGQAGAVLALGVLLKFLPGVLLPVLALEGRRPRWRLAAVCVAIVAAGLLASVLIWGPSTFRPIVFAASRRPEWSIWAAARSEHSPLAGLLAGDLGQWLERAAVAAALLAATVWSWRKRIGAAPASTLATLAVLLVYREGYVNYQMVVFCLLAWWAAKEPELFRQRPALCLFVWLYFAILAIADLELWYVSLQPVLHPYWMMVAKFALGGELLVWLGWVASSTGPAAVEGSG